MARILVVDGDERLRSIYSEDLAHEGHDVLTAATGFEALGLVERHLPDVVVTEVRLPGMDGLDLMERVLAARRETLVILNSESTYYKDSFLSWAADACLTKSSGTRELRNKLRELLGTTDGPDTVTRAPRDANSPGRQIAPRLGEPTEHRAET